MKPLLPFLFLSLLFSSNAQSQNYVNLDDKTVYDVEIIVFAYVNSTPDAESYSNQPRFETTDFLRLEPNSAQKELFYAPNNSSDGLSIALESQSDIKVLANFEKPMNTLDKAWARLQGNPNTKPLVHKSWRLSASEFTNPEYVFLEQKQGDNFWIEGGISLSKGRYLHLGNRLNLIRKNSNQPDIENVFSLTERKQIKTNEINYFDSPWLGVVAVVYEVKPNSKDSENSP